MYSLSHPTYKSNSGSLIRIVVMIASLCHLCLLEQRIGNTNPSPTTCYCTNAVLNVIWILHLKFILSAQTSGMMIHCIWNKKQHCKSAWQCSIPTFMLLKLSQNKIAWALEYTILLLQFHHNLSFILRYSFV